MTNNPNNQIAIEQKWERCQKTDEPAPPLGPDWVLELGDDRALLHPEEGTWYFFDAIHGEWSPTGIGVGEAILLTADGVSGAKRITVKGTTIEEKINSLAEWCFLLKAGELIGPLEQAGIPEDHDDKSQIWSPRSSQWLPLGASGKQASISSAKPSSAARFCTQCGAATHSGDKFCRSCGHHLS